MSNSKEQQKTEIPQADDTTSVFSGESRKEVHRQETINTPLRDAKQNYKKSKRLRNIILLCTPLALILAFIIIIFIVRDLEPHASALAFIIYGLIAVFFIIAVVVEAFFDTSVAKSSLKAAENNQQIKQTPTTPKDLFLKNYLSIVPFLRNFIIIFAIALLVHLICYLGKHPGFLLLLFVVSIYLFFHAIISYIFLLIRNYFSLRKQFKKLDSQTQKNCRKQKTIATVLVYIFPIITAVFIFFVIYLPTLFR